MTSRTTRWSAVRLVAGREVRERTRSRTFRIGTAVTVLLVAVGIVAPSLASGNGPPTQTVGFTGQPSPQLIRAVEQLGPALDTDVRTERVPDYAIGEQSLRDSTIALLVVPGQGLVVRKQLDPTLVTRTSRLVAGVAETVRLYEGLGAAGLPPDTVARALESRTPTVLGLEPAPQRDERNVAAASGSMILLFVSLTLYGAWILNGVIEEKTSRVVEVLLATMRPRELLVGKVLGIGLVGSIQGLVLVAATFAARAAVSGSAETPAVTPAIVAYTFLWFILGFGIYAWAYACAGALVSRGEDAQNLVFPLQLPLLASYVVGLASSINGPHIAVTVMSFVPFTAPMTMLVRMAAGEVAVWEVLLSIGLCVITIALVQRLAVAIFAGGILRSGQRVKVRDALRS